MLVCMPRLLHFFLFLNSQRLRGRLFLQHRIFHPLMIAIYLNRAVVLNQISMPFAGSGC